MEEETSPIAQRTARMGIADKGKLSKGLNLGVQMGGGLEDETTDFGGMNLSDASLLIESETPDISELMAQTPMKLNASGGWDRPTSATANVATSGRSTGKLKTNKIKSQAPEEAATSQAQTKAKPTLASLAMRSRAAAKQPPPPRTPPRRSPDEDEDYTESFEATPRAGYTFDLPQGGSIEGTPEESKSEAHNKDDDDESLLEDVDNDEPTVLFSKHVPKPPAHEPETRDDEAHAGPDEMIATGSQASSEAKNQPSKDNAKEEATSLDAAKMQEFTVRPNCSFLYTNKIHPVHPHEVV
jgi:hypothetical protein